MDYYTGFPTPEDSLGSTQLKFFTNWASVKTFVDTNHYDFANTLAGNHKWVLYGRQTGTFPDTSSPSALTIATYAAADSTPRTQLWFQPQNDATGANAIQLTAGDVTNATFSTNTVYAANRKGGWTFLPGGMIMQYGTLTDASMPSTGSMTFPIAFSAIPFSLTFGISRPSGSSANQSFFYDTLTATGFSFSNTSANNTPVSWVAIGKA